MNKNNNLQGKVKQNAQKGYQKAKEEVQEGKEKSDEIRHSSAWQKTKEGTKKVAEIVGSHLAAIKTSITLSNEEAELMENLKDKLNKKGFYPSKSEILRAGLWNLRNKNEEELKKAVEDLFKVKQTRIF
ncbi:hypothetical protein [endosymbiont GvMRE of Glomus versiforme]|uniref:hypothetical protein n=1 Tax=endosymbiont GvMRE of Glomus versiforme TaxID=2039283 RepID=UPI0011C49D22|nr:hypothetical protein [endosymbiont GvMRE of Glomus versiforme]